MKLIEFEDLPAMPWKNGGGVTRELHCQPAGASFDDFLWRVSIADVSQSGAFSSFAGVDRVITLLEGEGMDLVSDSGNHVLLSRLQPHRFRGEDKITAELAGGACQDFNLMLRRGAAAGEVRVWSIDQDLEQGCNLLFCAQGRWDVLAQDGEHATLEPRQSLVWEQRPAQVSLRSLSAGSVLIGVNIHLQ